MRIIISLLVSLVVLTSCGVTKDKNTAESNTNRMVKVKNTAQTQKKYKSNQKVADHLKDLAKSVPNVKNAAAVVIGPYAVVGIDVNAKLERSRVETIKYTVAESLKHDPNGASAIVVADPDLYQRLQDMRTQLRKGNSNGIMEELAAIVGRVMPQIPNDLIENKNVEPTKENDKELQGNEQEELKKKQEEQSNQHMKR
ncbi:YhcN/YlaJ family sporulation lipoprotein [Bacillus sp. 165]|uniref:YhcN/YlaJ family sporulation lipoprotein n=1 Tax=Bacillus sp. 165 TaxID=1529117 RepID=UPI001ADB8EC5|nr:YhcN/YlaJ family sporulation lipoprotein [Bacillus sp. 165]MBO9129234.1 YhcN/YlaJ family sporulation lipoprotein [Bacillus sp. 165]